MYCNPHQIVFQIVFKIYIECIPEYPIAADDRASARETLCTANKSMD